MKTRATTILAATIAAITQLHATSVNWLADSPSAFDVRISGTGSSYDDTITSPSGLWELENQDWFDYLANYIKIGQGAVATFLPNGAELGSVPWEDVYALESLPLTVLDAWEYPHSFQGINSISITSIPDIFDSSTWSWVVEYKASGPSLPVPESGSPWLLMAFASGLLLFFKRAAQA